MTFKFKDGYSLVPHLEITENVPHLEITEVLLVHCNIVNNDYQQDYVCSI